MRLFSDEDERLKKANYDWEGYFNGSYSSLMILESLMLLTDELGDDAEGI